MFEKEAEEYANRKCGIIQDNEWKFCKLDWQDGAEFGYNKANEWHFVKDGDLPNKGVLCAVLLFNNDLIFARLREDNVWTTNGRNAFENVIAWKEIVLPELKEIKD